MSVKGKKPDVIQLSSSELSGLKTQLETDQPLSESDKKVIISILTTYEWLYNQLKTARLGMRRLKQVFGFKTERNPNSSNKNSDEDSNTNPTDPESKSDSPDEGDNDSKGESPEKKT